jgi:hypothetical protein
VALALGKDGAGDVSDLAILEFASRVERRCIVTVFKLLKVRFICSLHDIGRYLRVLSGHAIHPSLIARAKSSIFVLAFVMVLAFLNDWLIAASEQRRLKAISAGVLPSLR